MVQFTLWVAKVKLSDRETWKAGTITKKALPLDTMTGDKFFAYWGLEKATIEFLTHACCLYRDDSYKSQPAIEVIKRMKVGGRARQPPRRICNDQQPGRRERRASVARPPLHVHSSQARFVPPSTSPLLPTPLPSSQAMAPLPKRLFRPPASCTSTLSRARA